MGFSYSLTNFVVKLCGLAQNVGGLDELFPAEPLFSFLEENSGLFAYDLMAGCGFSGPR